jgi:hypothetical protein
MEGQGQLAQKSSGMHMAAAFRTQGAAGWIGVERKIDREFDREFNIYRSHEILTPTHLKSNPLGKHSPLNSTIPKNPYCLSKSPTTHP